MKCVLIRKTFKQKFKHMVTWFSNLKVVFRKKKVRQGITCVVANTDFLPPKKKSQLDWHAIK